MGKATLGSPGRTPEARVKWALRFVGLDVARLSEQDRRRAWATLFAWQGGLPGQGPPPEDDGVPQAQQDLRECIEHLATGLPYMVWTPETGWALFPPPRRRPGGRRSGLITRMADRQQAGRRVIPTAVVFALVDDLNALGADRLRACGLVKDGQPCGVIFLASRRQLFCSAQHAQAAAWQRYQPKRKDKER
jgi:hypothetical protein